MAEILVTGDRHYVPSPTSSKERFRFSEEAGTGKLTLQTSRDSGITWTAIASEPPSNAGVGWIPTISEGGTIKWVSPTTALKTNSTTAGMGQFWVDFNFPAAIQNNIPFGVFEVPSETTLGATGLQLSLFKAPAIALSVSIISALSGEAINGIDPVTINGGQTFVSVNFPEVVQINSLTKLSANVTYTDAGETGEFLVARLIVKRI
jgi:hypothetical protein